MAKGANQKLKILYLMKIFLEQTDETHRITMSELLSQLESYGISAERKSIYNDIESLRQYGFDVIGEQEERTYYYYVGSRQFELAELKLLVDSVQSAKFITAKKSNELIKKIEALASRYEASQLQRQVFVSERLKTINENIYYNVDTLHTAINSNSKISFQYYNWNVNKEMELKKNGERYVVSPWALSWDDENYYMVAFDGAENKMKHFRVDKMLKIEILKANREGRNMLEHFDLAQYSKRLFGMFGGEEQMVTLECRNHFAGVMIDRFGKDVTFYKLDDSRFEIHVKVVVSRQFLAWVFALGEGIRITGPKEIVTQMQEEAGRLLSQYVV